MLICNDEVITLSEQEKKDIIDIFGRNNFPLRVVYPKERVKRSTSKHNRLPDKPAGISFPYRASLKTEKKGTQLWRYCEEVINMEDGKKRYIPSHFSYEGIRILDISDIELIYFLLRLCPYTKGGDNWNKKQPKLMFENPVQEANEIAASKVKEAEFSAMIYSNNVGLSEKKLREIAKALFISNVDKLTEINQVRVKIETMVKSSKDGMDKFFKMVNSEAVLTVRANIQKAIDEQYIKYVMQRREWVWCDSDGKKNELIFQLKSGVNPQDAIYDYYIADDDFRERLNSVIKYKAAPEPEPAGSGSGDPE